MTGTGHEVVEDASELEDLFRTWRRGPLRLVGSGSQESRLPAPLSGAATVQLRGMAGIDRLEPDDLTCSVKPGLTRIELDAELGHHGIELPCAGGGTLGGLFAGDPVGPLAPGGPSPRSLLLGIEGLLSDGTPFRAGARVVKSVAGYDLHKLFVGSRGRLFAATLLHLKLRKTPRGRMWFHRGGLEALPALTLFRRLRAEPVPPAVLLASRAADGWAVRGRLDGRPEALTALLRRHQLEEADSDPSLRLDPSENDVVVVGTIRPSRLPALLGALPEDSPFLVTGGGRFQVALSADGGEALLLRLPGIPAHGEILAGEPSRRGRCTPLDPGAARLGRDLKRALDPREVLV